MTLLRSYMKEKVDHYAEPARKGTPKGEPIGLSRAKYEASLLCLYDLKARHDEGLKAVAKTLKISYGLLRKWRTEEAFKKAIEEHIEEFSSLFLDFMNQKHQELKSRWDRLERQSLRKLVKEPLPSIADEVREPLSDAQFYSPALVIAISLKVFSAIEALEKQPFADRGLRFLVYDFILSYLRDRPAQKRSPLTEEEVRVGAQLKQALFENLKQIILKPKLSEEDRKEAMVAIKGLEQWIEITPAN